MYIRTRSYKEVFDQIKNSGELVKWQPGMSLFNSNGGIDSSTLGFQYTIQTTTLIRPRVTEQKFYEINFADYIPVNVGEGAWLEEIKTNVEYQSAGDFESGIQGTGQETRISNVETGIAPISYKIKTWVRGYQYSIPELQKALAADNWNPVEGKHRALDKNWKLGLQVIAFLGSYTDPTGVPGLLTNASVTTNTSRITLNISSMNYTQFGALVAGIMQDYFANSNSTVYPDHFMVPQSDWNGLGVAVNPQFWVAGGTMLDVLRQAFVQVTGNPNFVIYPSAYGDAANNLNYINVGTGKYIYCLYRKDPTTMTMDVPLNLTQLAPNTANNFVWNGVAYGQFTGVQIIRVPEVLYFTHS